MALEPATLLLPTDPTATAAVDTQTIPATWLAAFTSGALRIVRTPHLTTQALLLADQTVCPSYALATLNDAPVVETNTKLPLGLTAVALEMSVRNGFCVVPFSRRGLAKFTLS